MEARQLTNNISNINNKIAIVTGSNNGIGLETARELALRGYTVIMACRNLDKAAAARADILKSCPDANLVIMQLDLADLDSIRNFCHAFNTKYPRLDLLINNAGVMNVPRDLTKQGLEITMGTNFFGTFALTAGLYPSLLKALSEARIVTLGSNVHRTANIESYFSGQHHFLSELPRYANSKLADMMFAFMMDRLFKENHIPITSVAVHPGACAMNSTQSENAGLSNHLLAWGLFAAQCTIALTPAEGAQHVVRAATDPSLTGGEYLSPQSKWFGEMRGPLTLTKASPQAYDKAAAEKLWQCAENITDVKFTILPQEQYVSNCASAASLTSR